MKVVSRQDIAKEIGRRVSRGEFERAFSRLVERTSRVVSVSRGRPTGALRVTLVRDPQSPKARRKRDSEHAGTGKRARYT